MTTELELANITEILPAAGHHLAKAENLFLDKYAGVPNTRSTYQRALRRFFEWLRDEQLGHPFDLTLENAHAWNAWLADNFAKSTAALYGQAVSAFYKFITDPYIQSDYALERTDGGEIRNWFRDHAKAVAYKATPKPSSYIPEAKVVEMIDAAAKDNARDYMIMRLLYETGLRREEIPSLAKADIVIVEENLSYALHLQKCKRHPEGRYIGITVELGQTLLDYAKQTQGPWLFAGKFEGEHLQKRMMNYIVTKYGGKGMHPHRFRHTFATVNLLNGEPIQDVSTAMGHANIQTTMLYFDAANDLKRSVSRRMKLPYKVTR